MFCQDVPDLRVRDLGLYVHVPFCVSRCAYCDFNSTAIADPPWHRWQAAVCAELRVRAPTFTDRKLQSIYFGGGTPSLVPKTVMAQILETAKATFSWRQQCEITVEANPADLDIGGYEALRTLGVNRLSIGWQSSDSRVLQVLGRRHGPADGALAVQRARRAGFENVSVDLIFAVPGQTLADLGNDVEAVLAAQPEHVSTYELTYHSDTALTRRRLRGEIVPVGEAMEIAMLRLIDVWLSQVGFDRYEVSNYARPGYRAVHNSAYWCGDWYLGIGPGAHSFVESGWCRGWRWQSLSNLEQYLQTWEQPHAPGMPSESDRTVDWIEELTSRQLMTERILCGLRTVDGVDLDEPVMRSFADEIRLAADDGVRRGWASRRGSRLCPTTQGLLYADALAGLFF